MKTHRFLILAAAFAAAAVTSTTFAQAPGKPERGEPPFRGQQATPAERMDRRLDHLTQALNLTADQQTRIRAVWAAEIEQRKAIAADTTLSRDAKRERFEALREATVRQVDGVLTPEQLPKAQAIRARAQEHGEMRREKMKERGAKMKEHRERRQNPN